MLGGNNDAVVKMRELLKGKTGPKTVGNSGNNITEIGRKTVTGTRRDYTLDRLTRERPDLRARVDNAKRPSRIGRGALFARSASIRGR